MNYFTDCVFNIHYIEIFVYFFYDFNCMKYFNQTVPSNRIDVIAFIVWFYNEKVNITPHKYLAVINFGAEFKIL